MIISCGSQQHSAHPSQCNQTLLFVVLAALFIISVSVWTLPLVEASAGLSTNTSGSTTDAVGLIQTFTVKEAFGVTHPDQIIDFDLNQTINPASAYMIGPDGTEVPY